MKKNGTTAIAESPMHNNAISNLVFRSPSARSFSLASTLGFVVLLAVLVFIVQHRLGEQC
jgi:hypothetical protein